MWATCEFFRTIYFIWVSFGGSVAILLFGVFISEKMARSTVLWLAISFSPIDYILSYGAEPIMISK